MKINATYEKVHDYIPTNHDIEFSPISISGKYLPEIENNSKRYGVQVLCGKNIDNLIEINLTQEMERFHGIWVKERNCYYFDAEDDIEGFCGWINDTTKDREYSCSLWKSIFKGYENDWSR
jgi:hypothetical protein